MPKNDGDQVWYGVTRLFNTGNYESIKFEIGESRSVDGYNPDLVYEQVRKDVNNRMSAIVKKLKNDTEAQ